MDHLGLAELGELKQAQKKRPFNPTSNPDLVFLPSWELRRRHAGEDRELLRGDLARGQRHGLSLAFSHQTEVADAWMLNGNEAVGFPKRPIRPGFGPGQERPPKLTRSPDFWRLAARLLVNVDTHRRQVAGIDPIGGD